MNKSLAILSLAVSALYAGGASSQHLTYGAPISLELAKKVAHAATLEMQNKKLGLTIAVVDSGGTLVYLERSNLAPLGTADAAIGKAKSANAFKGPTKVLEESITKNNMLPLLGLPGAFPIEGGVPLIVNHQVIGAIGVSGAAPSDDGAVANVGAQSLMP